MPILHKVKMKHCVSNTLNWQLEILCPPAMTKGAEVIREDLLIPELPSVYFLMSFGAIVQKPVWALWSDKKCIVQATVDT